MKYAECHSELFKERNFQGKKVIISRTNTHNNLIISNMHNPFQYSHIYERLSVW